MAHLGNTVVNGALRVLGGEYVDTINGVTVGNSPKFTDTTYKAATAAPGAIASSGSAGSSTNYARQDHTHAITVATGDSDGQVKIAGQNASVKNCALKSDISTLQSNFQAGVDSVYNAIVARGTTPASKSLSDVVTGIGNIQTTHTGTYKPTTRASNCDMGVTHSYRYVNTTSVPNTNSGTYTPAGNAIYDMGATNTNRYCDGRTAFAAGKADHSATYTPTSRASNNDMGSSHSYRYVNTNSVPNSNSGTYTPAGNAIYDMGATNDKRYCDGRTAYSAGYAAKRSELTATYKPTSRATGLDMGSNHTYRYVNTTSVPNTNSGTYAVTSNGVKDMGSDNTQRYVNVNVPNSNSGTYTPTTKSTFDMGAANSNRYVDTRSVANVNSGTYSATSNGVKDMGADNTQRYVNVNVPNSNSGTASYDSNGIKDMGATNSYRYVNINVPHPTHTTTYTPTSRASNCDMGSVHSYRYVDTRSVPNSNSGTYTPAGNAIYDMGATNDKRYCDGRTAYTAGYNAKVTALTEIYKPTSRASNLDMGSNHSYRYVDTTGVPNSNTSTYTPTTKATFDLGATNDIRCIDTRSIANVNSGTYSTGFATNGTKDLGTSFAYRYITISVANSNSGTYTPTTKGTFDMGVANNKRYVDTRSVANVNSGTYTPLSNNIYDMGENNDYRYCDARSAYKAGWDAQNLSFIGSNRIQGKGNRSISMSALSPGRYLVITKSVPNIVNCGWSGACTCSLSTGTVENVLVHENKGGSGEYYWAYWIAIVKLTKTTPTNNITVTHKYGTTITSTVSMSIFKLG